MVLSSKPTPIERNQRTQLRPACGTQRGYRLHGKYQEPPCQNCKEANNAAWRTYYSRNSEHERARFRKNRLELPGYLEKKRLTDRAKDRRRRAKQRGNDHEPYTMHDILQRWGDLCHICEEKIDMEAPRGAGTGEGWERGLHLDHVIPLSKGGADAPDNVKPAHALCNLQKSAKHES